MKVYVDEVGCGACAGVLTVCAIAIADNTPKVKGVKDSKKLSKKKRESLFEPLSQFEHEFDEADIESLKRLNIHHAKYAAMRRAVARLSQRVNIEEVIVDGNFEIPGLKFRQKAVIKADEKYWQVGAASILAKVYRDNMMADLAKQEEFSYYDWENNAGYYTPKHRDGIIEHGPSTLHRTNYKNFRYALFEHLEFIKSGKTIETYLEWMETDGKLDGKLESCSRYVSWKNGAYDSWKPIVWGK